jgi:hypothetical protein
MHEPIIVHIPNSTHQIVENTPRFVFLKVFVLHNIIEELLSWTQLSRNVYEMVILEIFIHFHDVRMVLK